MPEVLPLAAALLVGLLYDPAASGLVPARPLIGAAAALGGILLAALFGWVLERRFANPPGRGWARAYLAFRFHPIALHAAVIHLFHWPALAEALRVTRSAAAASAVLVLPFLATLGVVWTWTWRIERPEGVRLRSWLGFHGRSAALVLSTYLVFAGAIDLLSLSRGARLLLQTWSVAEEAAVACVLGLLAFLLPLAARHIWKTRPLEAGALRDRLAEAARRVSFRCRDLLVWETSGLVANAAVVGFLPRWRYVVFTDALLLSLRPEEVEAVFGHEMGHAARRHVAASFLLGGAWVVGTLALSRVVFPGSEEGALLLLVPALLLAWLGYGWLSRRFELEADLYGSAVVGDLGTFVSALERANALSGGGRGRSSWRHFSVGSRVSFLFLVSARPEVGRRFRAKLRRTVRVGVGALALAGALHAVDLLRRTPGEVGWACLRIGDFARAERWLGRAGDHEKVRERLGLARFARGLAADAGRSPERLLARTRAAIEAGHLDFAGKVAALVEAVSEGEEEAAIFAEKAGRMAKDGDRAGLRGLFDEEGAPRLEALARVAR